LVCGTGKNQQKTVRRGIFGSVSRLRCPAGDSYPAVDPKSEVAVDPQPAAVGGLNDLQAPSTDALSSVAHASCHGHLP
jgi:hypothetical protein